MLLSLVLILNVLLIFVISAQELKFVIIVFNHGHRSPIVTFPNDQNKEDGWPQGFGQLSQKGMKSQYDLGEYLRKRYDNFLSPSYIRKEIYVQSFDEDVSLSSAYTLLNGLYPIDASFLNWNKAIQFQPIPVHPIKADIFSDNCPHLEKQLLAVDSSQEVQEFMKKYQVFLEDMELAIGCNLTSVFDLDYVMDALISEEQNGMSTPSWYSNLSNVYTQEIYPFQHKIRNNDSVVRRLSSGRIVYELVKIFNKKQQEQADDSLKLFLLSVDHKTVRSLLLGFDIFNYKLVPFSTAVIVELKKSDAGYFVNFWLKNDSTVDPTLLTLPGCSADCSLEEFVNLTSRIVPTNWADECYIYRNGEILKVTKTIMIAMLSCSGVIILTVCCCFVCCRKKQPKTVPRNYSKMRSARANAFPEEMPMMETSTVSSDLEDQD